MTFGLSAATLATVAVGAVSAGTAIAGAVSGPGGGSASGAPGAGGNAPNIYTPPAGDLGSQNTNFNNWNNYLAANNPWSNGGQQQYQGLTNNIVNNPYAAAYLQAATQNQGNASQIGQRALQAGQNMNSYAGAGIPSAQAQFGGAQAELNGAMSGLAAAQNNPYAEQSQRNANFAGMAYQNAANGQIAGAASLNPAAQSLNGINSGNAAQLGPAAQGINSQLQGLSNPLGGYGQQILNTAFDPQAQLYNQSFQQNQDVTNANLARAGLGSSAAGVGIADQSAQNFNTSWQNQQLGRQAQGLSSYGAAAGQAGNLLNAQLSNLEGSSTTQGNLLSQGLGAMTGAQEATQGLQNAALGNLYYGGQLNNQTYNSNLGSQLGLQAGAGNLAAGAGNLAGSASNLITNAGNQYGQAAGLGNTGLQANLYGAGLPYGLSNSINQNSLQALGGYQNAYAQGTAPIQGGIGNALQYMGFGANAGQAYANAAQNSWAQGNQANQQMYQGLAGLGNKVGGWLGGIGGGSGGGGGDFGGGGGGALSVDQLNPGGFGG